MFTVDTSQGHILDLTFRGSEIIGFRMHGIQIEDFTQPRLLGPDEQAAFMDRQWRSHDVTARRYHRRLPFAPVTIADTQTPRPTRSAVLCGQCALTLIRSIGPNATIHPCTPSPWADTSPRPLVDTIYRYSPPNNSIFRSLAQMGQTLAYSRAIRGCSRTYIVIRYICVRFIIVEFLPGAHLTMVACRARRL